ncbi:MAG: PucR family transcriptional regulator [Mycobacterium sp.]|nr:MAG: PucR family transcriptional regulator [Mycobacterium sp.]
MITLDRLVNVLGGYGVRLTHCPVPRSAELRSVALPETVGGRVVRGDVLLAVGAAGPDEALGWARAAHAVAVVVRAAESLAADPGTAVLTVDPELSWSELASVVYGLVLEGRETASGRGPTDLFALADSLGAQIGGATLIAGRRGDVLAYSRLTRPSDPAHERTILARQPPPDLREFLDRAGVFAYLEQTDEPRFIPADDHHGSTGRMVAAARAGRRLLGSVWVVSAAPLAGAALTALTTGAQTVALHLLRSQASADLERQVESELVARLLEGAADAATLASRLGLPQERLRVVAVRARRGQDPHAALLLAFERMTSGFGWSRPGRSTLAETTTYTVLPADSAATARSWLAGLVTTLPDDMELVAGISAAATAVELHIARREADECLALGERSGSDPAPAYDESWDDVVLGRLRTAAQSGRLTQRGPVAELRAHDSGHGTPYLVTLRAWLQAQGDPAVAGAALGVHENTVRYRLRRMAEITDLPLDDAGKRLAMLVELAVTEDD